MIKKFATTAVVSSALLFGSTAAATAQSAAPPQVGWTTGFYSPFNNGSRVGWTNVAGTWTSSGGALTTMGVPNGLATVKHLAIYGDVEYSARMKRTDSADGATVSGLIVRGNPAVQGTFNAWAPSYLFLYSNRVPATNGTPGLVGVIKAAPDGVTSTMLLDWTATPAVLTDDWNVLSAELVGSSLEFSINGQLVWSGTDPDISIGGIGLAAGSYGLPSRTDVDWVRARPVIKDLSATAKPWAQLGRIYTGTNILGPR